MYFHLVCSPEFFAVAFSRKSTRKLFRRSLELMVLKHHEFRQNPTSPPYAFHPLKPVRTPVAILGSLGVCIYVPASRHWLISNSPVHLN